MATKVQTLIIGAGPAGLAVGGRLREMGCSFELIERTDKIAWSWHNHYDRLCLHTVKQLSHLPHLPFPDHYPLYVPREDLASYYESYASHFDIHPHFGQEAKAVRRVGDKWQVETGKGMVFEAEQVVVASGVNRVPFAPTWEGQEGFRGEIAHSRAYKNPGPYKSQRTLIIGMGNTGAELALDLSEHGVEVCISVRAAVNIVPRDLNGRPTQLTARQLAKLPFGIGDWLGTKIRSMVMGDLSKYGLRTSTMPPARQLRETGKTPVIDLGTVKQIKAGKIKILPDIKCFYKEGVETIDGQRHPFDKVILATGYRAKIEEFIHSIGPFLDKFGVPRAAVGDGDFDGLYFVGFDNYKLGGILGTIFTDSETIALDIRERAAAREPQNA